MKNIGKFALILLLPACQASVPRLSQTQVTTVQQSPVKRQSIGNCWLYAQATWLESLLKNTSGEDINVSESYWTYWDLYDKLLEKKPIAPDELNTSGNWYRSSHIIRQHGWVAEGDFIADESHEIRSKAQLCAEDYIIKQGQKGGTLFDLDQRTPEHVRVELDKAFSCAGTLQLDMGNALAKQHRAEDTFLKGPTGEERSLTQWLNAWREISSPGYTSWGPYEGKKLGSLSEYDSYKTMEQRIKKALNDHQPVVISFFVSFNAPDENGLFNLNSLAQKGDLGETGGHMVVLHDYTVTDVPTSEGFMALDEGDLSLELKAAALTGNLEYVVVKNSWGYDRIDRPWLRNGYSRISWDYLRGRYFDAKTQQFLPFLRGVVLPPNY